MRAANMTPRQQLRAIPPGELDHALQPIDAFAVLSRIEQLDRAAPGGVSADATLLARMAVELHERTFPQRSRRPNFGPGVEA